MSSILNIWTPNRDEARSNSYATSCARCDTPVMEKSGLLVSTYAADGSALKNRALHPSCSLPSGWMFRAQIGKGVSIQTALGNMPDAAPEPEAQPEAQPEVQPEQPAREPTEAELEATATAIVKRVTDQFLGAVPNLVRSTMHEATRKVEITIPKMPTVKVDTAHRILPDIIMAVVARTNPFIVGPAGSGKTTLCQQVAQAIGRKFYMSNSVAGKHELLGFRDAHGQIVETDFFHAFTKGGLFLFDEADNSNPNALVALNSAIANGYCEFAGKLHKAHKDFQVIAAANTFGRGADGLYVGRNKLDAATLDRFQTYVMDYDEELERELAGNDDWVAWVQKVRSVIYSEKILHVVSPRASIAGARLLAAGMDRSKVEESCVWKGLDNNHRVRITARLGA
jgi:cobaltochelatase CobS